MVAATLLSLLLFIADALGGLLEDQQEYVDCIADPENCYELTLQCVSCGLRLISGTIPSSIKALYNLNGFTITDNSVSGTIPPELSECSSLVLFDVAGNPLSGTIPFESLPTSLQKLTIGRGFQHPSTRISGTISAAIAGLTNLMRLDVSGAPISAVANEFCAIVPRLTSTQWSSCNFVGTNITQGDHCPTCMNYGSGASGCFSSLAVKAPGICTSDGGGPTPHPTPLPTPSPSPHPTTKEPTPHPTTKEPTPLPTMNPTIFPTRGASPLTGWTKAEGGDSCDSACVKIGQVCACVYVNISVLLPTPAKNRLLHTFCPLNWHDRTRVGMQRVADERDRKRRRFQ